MLSDHSRSVDGVLLLAPTSGLANRLRTLLGFHLVSKDSPVQRSLEVYWNPDPVCPGHFLDCFLPIPGVKFVSEDRASEVIRRAHGHGAEGYDNGTPAGTFKGQATLRAVLKRWAGTTGPGAALLAELESGRTGAIAMAQLYTLVTPVVQLAEMIDSFSREHEIENRVGLHIRRTDHTRLAEAKGRYSSDERFLSKIRQELTDNPATLFFLATDNAETQRKFTTLDELRGRVVVFDTIPEVPFKQEVKCRGRKSRKARPDSTRHTSLKHAVIDAFLLSRCTRIYGSMESTFSQLAYRLRASRLLHTRGSDGFKNAGEQSEAGVGEDYRDR